MDFRKDLSVGNKTYKIFGLEKAKEEGLNNIDKLPKSLKVLLENLLRFEKESAVSWDDVKAIDKWVENCSSDQEIAYHPARVVMPDFTGVPAVVDLAAMSEAIE